MVGDTADGQKSNQLGWETAVDLMENHLVPIKTLLHINQFGWLHD